MLLDELSHTTDRQDVFRLVSLDEMGSYANEMGLDAQDVGEVVDLFQEEIIPALLSGPFRSKVFWLPPHGYASGRVSDGSWPVFYASVERETSEEEIAHNRADEASGTEFRVLHFTALRCTVAGTFVDLRPNLEVWPDLIAEDVSFCQELGREASGTNVDAFYAPSARVDGGTNVPTFRQSAVSNGVIEGTTQFTLLPQRKPNILRL